MKVTFPKAAYRLYYTQLFPWVQNAYAEMIAALRADGISDEEIQEMVGDELAQLEEDVRPRKKEVAHKPPTISIAEAYQRAFDYFNAELFLPILGEKLPQVIINQSRKNHAMAWFSENRWKDIRDGTSLAEISIVPEWTDRPIKDVLATLVHEMAHYKDHLDGTACKNGRHGRAWFKIMKKLGLPGRALSASMTRVTHDIEEGGAYDKAFAGVPADLIMPFKGVGVPRKPKNPDSLQGMRFKYECPQCGTNVRGKMDLNLKCLDCDETFFNTGS